MAMTRRESGGFGCTVHPELPDMSEREAWAHLRSEHPDIARLRIEAPDALPAGITPAKPALALPVHPLAAKAVRG